MLAMDKFVCPGAKGKKPRDFSSKATYIPGEEYWYQSPLIKNAIQRPAVFAPIDTLYRRAIQDDLILSKAQAGLDDANFLCDEYYPLMLTFFHTLERDMHEIHVNQYEAYAKIHNLRCTWQNNNITIVEPPMHISTWAAIVTELLPDLASIRIAEEHVAEKATERQLMSDEELQEAAKMAPLQNEPVDPRPVGQAYALMKKGDVGTSANPPASLLEAPTQQVGGGGDTGSRGRCGDDDEEDEEGDQEGDQEGEDKIEGVVDDEVNPATGSAAVSPAKTAAGLASPVDATPQRRGKRPAEAFVMADEDEIASPSKTPKTAEENETAEKEEQAAKRK
ncbi:hypothetical protein CYMTET_19007 [Cymbomonas tetramitiformis]|uniref:Uncharacterized protein n=1 Tax=Cymbomonas tetramitiformis TaxID=36881 RepID=A0AAE0G7H1_9CHLO|nr:hypothetical protein CYMTET_19007 [Cymbomonas tetramitiformis]